MVTVPAQGFRRVMHCDLDCFFAAVEELDNPALVGKPVIVGGDPDRRGVVSTANYVARRYGIHSAMAAAIARRLCPQAIFLRPRFERYKELSQQVMAILDEYFTVREQVSIDEAYGELPPGQLGCRPAEAIAREIKARVREETGLTISVGVAQAKSIAKIASDFSKPDGCVIVKPGTEEAFLHPLPVERLSGVGKRTREQLEKIGVTTIGQLAAANMQDVQGVLGKHGVWLYQVAHAQDDRPVVSEHGPPKSVSSERTYERDIADLERATEQIEAMAADVARRAEREDVTGRTVTLKVKWHDFRTMTRQQSLPEATREAGAIAQVALELLRGEVGPLLETGAALRLIGVGLSGIVTPDGGLGAGAPRGLVQLRLFEDSVNVA